MITDAIVGAFLAGLDALFGLMPTIEFFTSGLGLQLPEPMYRIFPIVFLAQTVGICMAVILGMQLWNLIVFVYHQFWGSN